MARVMHLIALVFTPVMIISCSEGDTGYSIPPFNLFFSLAVADLNNDGLQDIATCYTHIAGSQPHPGYVAVYLQNEGQPAVFTRVGTYQVGDDPVSIATGDLNADGKPDIATANNHGDIGVSVLIQDPVLPGKFLPAESYKTGPTPTSVSIGDLNGDGKNDLVVGDDHMSILFQNSGAPGVFLPATSVNGTERITCVAITDINGDMKQDLIGTTTNSELLVILQDPANAGIFLTPSHYFAGEQPYAPDVSDLNGDGKPDIAVALYGSVYNGSGRGVAVLLQNLSSSSSFFPPVHYDAEIRPQALVINDLNDDGKPDLIVSNSGGLAGACPPDCGSTGSSISILLQLQASPGNFQAAINYPATGTDFITWVAVGDINGDGKPDLIITQANGLVIRLQDPLHPGQFMDAVPVAG